MALSPREMDTRIVENLAAKTGRDLGAWLALVHEAGLRGRDAVAWLKAEHGVGHVTAQVIARHAAEGAAYADAEALLSSLRGKHPEHAALFDAVRAAVRAAMPDAQEVPCKTYVGYRTDRQRAALRPRRDGVEAAFALGSNDAARANAARFGGGGLTHTVVVRDRAGLGEVAALAARAVSR